MSEYLDAVVKVDQCAQYVADIGIETNITTDLRRNIRAAFQCICNAGLKLTIKKCHFGVMQVNVLGRTISSESLTTKSQDSKFPKLLEIPQIEKGFAEISGFCEIVERFHSQDGRKSQPTLYTLKSRSRNEHHLRIEGKLLFSKQSTD